MLPIIKGISRRPARAAARGGPSTVIGLICFWGAPRKGGLWSWWGSHGSVEGENLGPNWSLSETLSIKKGTAPQKARAGGEGEGRPPGLGPPCLDSQIVRLRGPPL